MGFWNPHCESVLHSIPVECRSRPPLTLERTAGLGSAQVNNERLSRAIRSLDHIQVRPSRASTRAITFLRQDDRDARVEGPRCVPHIVARRAPMVRSPAQYGTAHHQTHYPHRSTSDARCPKMARQTLVAGLDAYRRGRAGRSQQQRAPTGAPRCGDLEEHQLDVRRGAGQWRTMEDLRIRSTELLENAWAPSTRREYTKWWVAFLDFCELVDQAALPAEEEMVELFLCAMSDNSQGAGVPKARAAIAREHLLANVRDPTKGDRMRLLTRAIGKKWAREDRRPLVRELVPLWTIHHWIAAAAKGQADPGRTSLTTRTMIACLLSLGVRGMLRPRELIHLDIDSIRYHPESTPQRPMIVVSLGRTKTDLQGLDSAIPIEGTGTISCPIGLWTR